MPWFKTITGIRNNPKVKHLCGLLRNPLADAYWSRLLDYCAEQQADGRFPVDGGSGMLEEAVSFRGEEGALLKALLASGLMEQDGNAYVVHDWAVEQAPLVAKFKRDREKTPKTEEPQEEPAPNPRGIRADASPSLVVVSSASSTSVVPTVVANHVAPARVALSVPDERRGGRRVAPVVPPGESFPDRLAALTGWSWTPGVDDKALRDVLALCAREPGELGLQDPLGEILRRVGNGHQARFQRVTSLTALARTDKWRACSTPEERRHAPAKASPRDEAAQREREVGRSTATERPPVHLPCAACGCEAGSQFGGVLLCHGFAGCFEAARAAATAAGVLRPGPGDGTLEAWVASWVERQRLARADAAGAA
jgi:hypothetical protein